MCSRLLINSGADLAKTAHNKRQPITEAVHQHTLHYDVIIELLRGGVDIDSAICDCHTSPLNTVLSRSNMAVFSLLIQVDAKLDIFDSKRKEMERTYPEHYQMVKLLIKNPVPNLII